MPRTLGSDDRSRILDRITRQLGLPQLMDALVERLPASDLQSLLLAVYAERARKIPVTELLRSRRTNRFVAPSEIDARLFHSLHGALYRALPAGFEALELSPLAPLGSCAAMAGLDQKRVVSTARNTEVVADATNSLALECALRRKAALTGDPTVDGPVKVCAAHRQVRGQAFDNPKYSAHFRVFCLATADRTAARRRFEREALLEHLRFYLDAVGELIQAAGGDHRVEVLLTDLTHGNGRWIEEEIARPLRETHARACFALDDTRQSGARYYRDLCFRLRLVREGGEAFDFLVDGGFTDWTQQLLGSRKERLLTSALGVDYLVRVLTAERLLSLR